jgi:hypothetical protein
MNDRVDADGKRVLFVTNNSTKSRAEYVAKLRDTCGIAAEASEVLSSAYAAALWCRGAGLTKKVYVVGQAGLAAELRAVGLEVLGMEDFEPPFAFGASRPEELDGEVQAVVPKQIISKVGVTKAAVTRRNDKIEALCKAIQKCFRADGPFNVQLVLDKDGEPWPFEINPRFSTSITLTNAAGADELGGLLSQALFGRDSYRVPLWQEGVVLIRHTTDQFISEEQFKNVGVTINQKKRK